MVEVHCHQPLYILTSSHAYEILCPKFDAIIRLSAIDACSSMLDTPMHLLMQLHDARVIPRQGLDMWIATFPRAALLLCFVLACGLVLACGHELSNPSSACCKILQQPLH